jgi:hypothetical protein
MVLDQSRTVLDQTVFLSRERPSAGAAILARRRNSFDLQARAWRAAGTGARRRGPALALFFIIMVGIRAGFAGTLGVAANASARGGRLSRS